MAKFDIYQHVTDTVIAQMEKAGKDWQAPFTHSVGLPENGVTGHKYQGINILLLGLSGYPSKYWASYKQWRDKGYQVRKGEHGSIVVFWKILEKEDKSGNKQEIPFLRYSKIFNASQVEGAEHLVISGNSVNKTELLAHIERYVQLTGAQVVSDYAGAFYNPAKDFINMPAREAFQRDDATEGYYSTLLHELTHWTGHKSRLDRLKIKNRKGYAFEELIAELGAAIQSVVLGIVSKPRDDHAEYLNNWIEALQNDKRYIFDAAKHAQKAVDYLSEVTGVETSKLVD